MKNSYPLPMGSRAEQLCKEAASRDYTKAIVLLGCHYLKLKPALSAACFSVAAKRGNEDARFFDTLFNVDSCSDKFAAVFALIKTLLTTKNIKKPRWRMANRMLGLIEKHCPSHQRFPNQLDIIEQFLQRRPYQASTSTEHKAQRRNERIGDWYASGSGPVPRHLGQAIGYYCSADTNSARVCAKIAEAFKQLCRIPDYLSWLQRAALKAHEPSYELLCEYQNTLKGGRGYTKVLPQHHEAVWFKLITEARMGEAYFYLARMLLRDRPQAEYKQPKQAPEITNLFEQWFFDDRKYFTTTGPSVEPFDEESEPQTPRAVRGLDGTRWQFALRLLGSPRCKVPPEHQQECAEMKAQLRALILFREKEEVEFPVDWGYLNYFLDENAVAGPVVDWLWSIRQVYKINSQEKRYRLSGKTKKRWRDILRPWLLVLSEREMPNVSAAERERIHRREVEDTRAVLQRIQDNARSGISTKCFKH
eukprot:TRINITY_DN2369_c0_g1_i1.p1 TRINITY_DN2369_c0_g1~~TRINITY_DN2369_c0_g1_i1.p1  ORF type:complete len:476 (+),score=66.89 TRINITY_DN2369_c0_g1_i1:2133-3560(+)